MVLFKEIYVVLLFPCAQIDLLLGAKKKLTIQCGPLSLAS